MELYFVYQWDQEDPVLYMAFIFPIYFVPRGLHFNQNYTKHMNWICKLGTLNVFDFNNNNT